MTTDQLRIDKNKLSDINQRISLMRRKHPVFNELNGERNQANILKAALDEKNNEMARLLDELKQLQNTLQSLASSANTHNISSIESSVKKYSEEIDLISAKLAQLDEDIPIIKAKRNSCDTSEYLQYCNLITTQRRLERSVADSEPSLLAAFFYDEKQKRTLPVNFTASLRQYLYTMWGQEFSNKHQLTPHFDKESEIDFRNPSGRSMITMTSGGNIRMYLTPSQNESLAQAMIEMYFKSIENKIDSISLHTTSGPDADFLGKKIALGLQQRGYLDHKVNGRLVTEILGIEKKLEQPLSQTERATTDTAPSLSPSSTAHKGDDAPLPKKEEIKPPSTAQLSDTEQTLPEWYTKPSEQDTTADSNNTIRMRR